MNGRSLCTIGTRLGVSLFAASSAAISTFAQCSYDVTIIQGPTHPVYGAPVTIPTGLNNLGHVVGYYSYRGEDERGFLWTPEGGLQTLPLPPDAAAFEPRAINNFGTIVGTADVPARAGFLGFVLRDGDYTYIDPLPDAQWSSATAINDAGAVVGDSTNVFVGPLWAIRLFGDQTEALTLSDAENSSAVGVNDLGWIAGWAGTSPGTSASGFLIRSDSITYLGFLPGGTVTQPFGLSNTGDVVGRATVRVGTSTVSHAFLSNGQTIVDLGTLPSFRHSFGYAVADDQTVVGYCRGLPGNSNAERAFVRRAGTMQDLTALLDGAGQVVVTQAYAINAAGQIIGVASNNGNPVGVLLTPQVITGDLDSSGSVDLNDLALLLSDFGCEGSFCPGDLDQDGATTLQDLALVLTRFGAACP